LQRWRTADDFVDGWNEFFGDHSDSSINRTIVLLDAVYHRFEHGYEDNYKVMYKIVQLNRETLIEMWSRAADRVEALLRINFLKRDIWSEIEQGFMGIETTTSNGRLRTWDDTYNGIWTSNTRAITRRRFE
jgi:hypothetical protein